MSTKLISVTIPVNGIDHYTFLDYGMGQARLLWQDPSLTIAGIGTAAELIAWGEQRYKEIEAKGKALFERYQRISFGLEESDHSRVKPYLLGGFSFTPAFVPDVAWAAFYPAHFILPHYQLVQFDGKTFLSIHFTTPAEEELEPIISELENGLYELAEGLKERERAYSDASPSPRLTDIAYPMSKPQWEKMLEQAIDKMTTGPLDKVVLARISELQTAEEISITQLLPKLTQRYPNCNIFLFEPRDHNAFFGATPETLVDVEGEKISTMGLAGSARRGETPEADAEFGQALLDSQKNQIEHKHVVDAIRTRLEPLTTTLDIEDQPTLLKLSNIQHLYTPIEGKLCDPQGILPLLETLHPTPALGGKPRELAMDFISSEEPITRGWYGAPVGFLDPNLDGRFGVAIRSAIAQRFRVWAYAGAGIVADSIPDEEWTETAIKFRPMLDLFE